MIYNVVFGLVVFGLEVLSRQGSMNPSPLSQEHTRERLSRSQADIQPLLSIIEYYHVMPRTALKGMIQRRIHSRYTRPIYEWNPLLLVTSEEPTRMANLNRIPATVMARA